MCQLVEKTVCCAGQASLAVDRHRRVNTLLKMTEDYKKAKELLDKNEDVISQSENCIFGKASKKSSKSRVRPGKKPQKSPSVLKKEGKRKVVSRKRDVRYITT